MAATSNPVLDFSSNAGLYLIPVAILAPLALGLCATRVYTKLKRTGRLHIDDWTIIAAEVCKSILLMENMLIDDAIRRCRLSTS
jgi:hypothetical protein